MIGLSAIFLSAAVTVPVVAPPPAYIEMIARVKACGPTKVIIRYEDELQADLILVGDDAVSDRALVCTAGVVAESGFLIEFQNDIQPRYYEQVHILLAPKVREAARVWLAQRNLLDKVPDFASSGLSDEAFAKKLESICGPRATGAFGSSFGTHTLSPDFKLGFDDESRDVFGCLLYASVWSGFGIGFIGNEAAQ